MVKIGSIGTQPKKKRSAKRFEPPEIVLEKGLDGEYGRFKTRESCCCCSDNACIDLTLLTKGVLATATFMIVCFVAVVDETPRGNLDTRNLALVSALSMIVTIANYTILTVMNVLINIEAKMDCYLALRLVRFWKNSNGAFMLLILFGMLVTQSFVIGAFVLSVHSMFFFIIWENFLELEYYATFVLSANPDNEKPKQRKVVGKINSQTVVIEISDDDI